MPITYKETPDSPVVNDAVDGIEVRRTYVVDGTDDPLVAVLQGPAKNDQLVVGGDTLYVKEKNAEPLAVSTDPACTLEVIYRTNQFSTSTSPSGTPEVEEIDMTAGQEHITAVEKQEQQLHYPVGDQNGIYTGQSIGVVGKRVEGTDRYIPAASFSLTRFVDPNLVNTEFKTNIWELTGKVNDAPFRDWEEGEALFLGARMSRQGEGFWNVTYLFLGNKNATLDLDLLGSGENVNVGQQVPKTGWQYVWYVHSELEKDAGGLKGIEGVIKSAHVATIYQAGDFGLLGLT